MTVKSLVEKRWLPSIHMLASKSQYIMDFFLKNKKKLFLSIKSWQMQPRISLETIVGVIGGLSMARIVGR